jgi:acyl-CoA thioester hydrolase
MPSEHHHKRQVQFYETDQAGIVHFSWFYRYMEEAEHALWREAGLSIAMPGRGIGWPRISATCEFYRPLRFEDEFDVWIRIAEISDRRIRYSCRLSKSGEKIATGEMTIACVSREPGGPMKSISIPQDIVVRFQVYNGKED